MPPQRISLPAPPQPIRVFFDPFNSSSTGHQRAENRSSGSTSWRDSRSFKLGYQFRDATGSGGQKHLSDLVGAGSEHSGKDGKKANGDWEADAPRLREKGWQDIRGMVGSSKKRPSESISSDGIIKKRRLELESAMSQGPASDPLTVEKVKKPRLKVLPAKNIEIRESAVDSEPPQIFRGLTMYLNGSTMPLVSDHRLKKIFVQHGGNTSIALGRRTVTHVILGQTCGGGLASGKIQKENTTVRGKGIKYVNAEWVLDSVEKGKRQPEARYAATEVKQRIGGAGQASVMGLFQSRID